jgi:GT2 family glycosyltransferase
MYGEDLDWAFRIKKLGWKVLYNGQVEVFHHKGESSRQRSTRSIVEFYRAMLVFYRKHYAKSTSLPIHWLVIAAIYLRGMLALAQNQARSSVRRPSR